MAVGVCAGGSGRPESDPAPEGQDGDFGDRNRDVRNPESKRWTFYRPVCTLPPTTSLLRVADEGGEADPSAQRVVTMDVDGEGAQTSGGTDTGPAPSGAPSAAACHPRVPRRPGPRGVHAPRAPVVARHPRGPLHVAWGRGSAAKRWG